MKKITYVFAMIFTIAVAMFLVNDVPVYASNITSEVIEEQESDTNPIPDKYNTGATEPEGGFEKVTLGGSFSCKRNGENDTLTFAVSGGVRNVFNLAYGQKDLNGVYTIENVDFTTAQVNIYNEQAWDSNSSNSDKVLKFIFKNCKFSKFSTCRCSLEHIFYTFENCSFENLNGSNMAVTRCYFGGSYTDRINPFSNASFKYCYVSNPTYGESTDALVHVDGTQIFGDNVNKIAIHDVYFDNCRFEVPNCQYPNAPDVKVNACIMLQLEYSSGYNMSFTNCIVNGGGYTVYAHTTSSSLTLENVSFKNISVGAAKKWGTLYPDKSSTIDFNLDTWKDTDALYVGSVWQDTGSTSISVTNDTNQERSFRVYTSLGNHYDYTIAACPIGKKLTGITFEDLPFDQVYTIPEKCKWIVVYEKTTDDAGNVSYNQIRYKDFGATSSKKSTLIAYTKANSDGEKIILETSTPKTTKITKLTSKKKGFKVKWKKITKGIAGYQIQCSTSKDFSKNVKTKTIKSSKRHTYCMKNLKRKKRYYVRVRCYKTVKKYSKKQRVYSAWSKVKKVKTK